MLHKRKLIRKVSFLLMLEREQMKINESLIMLRGNKYKYRFLFMELVSHAKQEIV